MSSIEEILLSCHMDSSFFPVISVQLTMTPRLPWACTNIFLSRIWASMICLVFTLQDHSFLLLECCKNWSPLGRYVLRIANLEMTSGNSLLNHPVLERERILWPVETIIVCGDHFVTEDCPPAYYYTPFCFSVYICLSHFFKDLNITYL